MDDLSKKSLNYPSYFDTNDKDLIKPILSTFRPKTYKVLSTLSKKTPTKNKEDGIDKNNLEDILAKLCLDEVVTIKNDGGKNNLEDILAKLCLDEVVTIKNDGGKNNLEDLSDELCLDEVVTIKNDDGKNNLEDLLAKLCLDEVVTIKNDGGKNNLEDLSDELCLDEVVTIKNDDGKNNLEDLPDELCLDEVVTIKNGDCKDNLEDLLDELCLDEVVTIKNDDGKESSDDDLFEKEKVFYEVGRGCNPEEILKLEPWNKKGPILKRLPNFNEMEDFIKKKKHMCLLLHCENIVVTKNIKIYSFKITPWDFLCLDHQNEVAKRYKY
jgi:hypothetical protein